METARIEMSRHEAHKLWQKYQSHKHNRGPLAGFTGQSARGA